jgi:hypothetical protein
MERHTLPGIVLLLAVVALVACTAIGFAAANRYCAYQSNHSGRWHIYALRTIGPDIDTVQVSPPTGDPPFGFTEPTVVNNGFTLYCAMLAHKQSIGDSAYVMVRKSTDWGTTWTTLTTIGENAAIARRLRAAYSDGTLSLIWEDCRSGTWEVYYEEIQ